MLASKAGANLSLMMASASAAAVLRVNNAHAGQHSARIYGTSTEDVFAET
jgi:hypothetical protein